ncbi:hypothetical protein NIES4103_23980 [Nostoc sp. NIES-4103]|nr:hypothetical protein NIES4103_23980 [Nostoc sp. NIES-4103]
MISEVTEVTSEQIAHNTKLAVAFHAPFNTGDVDALDEILHPNWVNHPQNPHERPGPEGYKQTITWLRSVFPDLEFTVEDMIAQGDKVIGRLLATGTHQAEFLGVKPTGKRITFRAIDIHRFENGRIMETWHVEDIYGMLAQIGVIDNVYGCEIDPYTPW